MTIRNRNNQIQTISILGSGWLGLPLAEHFLTQGYQIHASTRSTEHLNKLKCVKANAFIVDIDNLSDITQFLQADCLIINITCKNLTSFTQLIKQIEQSSITKVLFVSSTSVYDNLNKVVTEAEGAELEESPLWQIEQLFSRNLNFTTTIVRFSGLVGYSRHPGNFFRPGKVVAQPEAPVNLIHRDDCIGIISAIIEQNVWGEVFNACAATHPSKREFYTHARNLLNLPTPKFANTTETTYKIVSHAKVQQVLNYQFMHPDLMSIRF
ncbi:NAD(P)H-binding protein [Methyloprofundus sedimenti]|uniref:NAD(P)H-binding protein n=1 Tax=Methyloprofundus sedimenti TaxID=1420851 RepID=UPI00117EB9BD|nr:NAD(P)H-binding protein [Methyloprofundus sedimenti]